MTISINGQLIELANERSLRHYLPPNETGKPFAVAVNGEFVARADYTRIMLEDGDEIDIVQPVGGG